MTIIFEDEEWTLDIGGRRYGFVEYSTYEETTTLRSGPRTVLELGPLGKLPTPFSPVICVCLSVGLVGLLVAALCYAVFRGGLRRRPAV
jgi:hypothetical protein